MDNTLVVTIVVAILGSGGLWSLIQWFLETRVTKKAQFIKDIKEKMEDLVTTDDLEGIKEEIKKIGVDSAQAKDLSLAIARDRINFLCNKYLRLGYIPLQDYVSFKEIGESYIKAGGNSEIKSKFELVMEDLEVKSEE